MAEARNAISTVLVRLRAEDRGAARWYYLDENGAEQGPFDSDQMQKWSIGFPDDLMIRGQGAAEWVRLCDISPNIFRSSMKQDVKDALSVLRNVREQLDRDGAAATVDAITSDAPESGSKFCSHEAGQSRNMSVGGKNHSRNSTWIKQVDEKSGHTFFYDTASGQSKWELPLDETL